MAEVTAIEWTSTILTNGEKTPGSTFNPWWGCVKVSEACRSCYAATLAERFGTEWGPTARRRFFGEKHWNDPYRWDKKAKEAGVRHKVFCASMADVFEILPKSHPDSEEMSRARSWLWDIIQDTKNLDWLLLTKRPENAEKLVPLSWTHEDEWPDNAWLGVTAETRKDYDFRTSWLRSLPAPIRFLSCEPLLEDLGDVDLTGISWVICGGESGNGARPMHPDWVRNLRDRCVHASVPFHFKQWGAWKPIVQPPLRRQMAPNERWLNLAGGQGFHGEEVWLMRNVGKKLAGRILDNREWNGMPR